jgi:Tfp pilus assembly protein PilE
MKLKNQHEHVLVKNDDYEIAIVAEGNLLVEWFSWFVATIVSIGFFCLYTKFVCPEVWSYIVMNKSSMASIALIISAFVFAVYFGYNNYQEKKQLQKDKAELSEKIEQLNQNIAKNNQITADNELSKRELENESIERQEQINEQLKNNDCANKFVPGAVSNKLYNRAKSLRQSANTGESTNRQYSRATTKINEIRG